MPNAIITSFITHSPDPLHTSRKIGLAADPLRGNALASARLDQLTDYIYPWVTTLEQIKNCERIILHDGIPAELRLQFPWIRFEEFPVCSQESIWVTRFRHWCEYLERRTDLERVFFTDINDVAVFRDPFEWQSSLGVSLDLLLVGEEWTLFRDNEWFRGAYAKYPPKIRAFFEESLPNVAPVCAGTWGGRRETAHSLLKFAVGLMDEHRDHMQAAPRIGWDMVFFNYALLSGAVVDRFATVKLEDFGPLHHHGGVTIRGLTNPFLHDRPSVMKRLAR